MTNDLPAFAEFNLGPGTKLKIGKSRVTVRFQFEKGIFTDYLDRVLTLPEQPCEVVDAAALGIKLPDGLVGVLIAQLAQHAAADFTLGTEASKSTKTENTPSKH